MGERITAVCGHCKKVLYQGLLSLNDPRISHGQCKPCQEKFLWQAGLNQEELTEFINERNQRETAVEA